YLDSSSSSMGFLPARGSAPAPSRLRGAPLGVLLDDEREIVVRPLERALDATAVDEDGGRRLDAQARTRADVLRDAGHGGGVVEAGAELRDVEAEVARVAEEAVAVEGLLMLEEQVVVLPESILLTGALRGGRGLAGVGMKLLLHLAIAAAVEREVAEDQLHV